MNKEGRKHKAIDQKEKPLRVIEPSVIRLTSDETRMLMKAAVNPKGVQLYHNGQGVLELGLIEPVKGKPVNNRQVLKKLADQAKVKCLLARTWKALQKALKEHEQKNRDYQYVSSKPEKLYTLTKAGKALVSLITIRRR